MKICIQVPMTVCIIVYICRVIMLSSQISAMKHLKIQHVHKYLGQVLHNPGVCPPLKPGSFQQTRVPHSLPMGVN